MIDTGVGASNDKEKEANLCVLLCVCSVYNAKDDDSI